MEGGGAWLEAAGGGTVKVRSTLSGKTTKYVSPTLVAIWQKGQRRVRGVIQELASEDGVWHLVEGEEHLELVLEPLSDELGILEPPPNTPAPPP